MNSRARTGLLLAFCASLGLHGVAYASLAAAPPRPQHSPRVSEVNFQLPPLPTSLPEPEPAPPTETHAALEPASRLQAAPPVRAPQVVATPTPTATAVTPEAALDLGGVTLTNDSSNGFAMPVGNGSALHGPIGLGASSDPVSRMAAPVATSAPHLPTIVAVSDLSERPKPPSLSALLRANYPEEARLRGLRGAASLRARIDADGVIRNARLLSESSSGFGAACRRTVLGSHWSAPRDKNGAAVATEIVYTCHFEVDQ